MHKISSMQKNEFSEREPTLVDQAFARLRHDVLSGTYVAGVKLKVDELQSAYGFSSSPLREALTRLAQEGLVRADERRGFRVAPISLDDMADITRMRLILDLPALRESITLGGDAWESEVVAAFHRLELVEARLPDGPVILDDTWSELHRDFHLSLLAACPSERQRRWGESLFDQAERYRRFSGRFRKTSKRKTNEHRRIMDAALRRDADTACALLEEHMRSTLRNVENILKDPPKAPT
ncbi:GntR family transcriptional regulator [Variovorax sp. PBS-H4]|uniref:GntR family transcriptional regulator n=1 Tax=Variovorax sp. PBS-H4 TaxID=434008 RepID=UPI0013A58AFD|nr:FCD domain-containing protein [Variovorax sp. PBS-H4]